MVFLARPHEEVLDARRRNGQLKPSSWVMRLDESALDTITTRVTVRINNLNAYCIAGDDGELYLNAAGFKRLLQQFVPGNVGYQVLDTALPILWKMLVYISRYPFEAVSPLSLEAAIAYTITRNAFLRTLILLHPLFSDQLFNGDNDGNTRCHTNADQRRLLFQAISSHRHIYNSPDSEAFWDRKSLERASRYWPTHSGVQLAYMPYNMGPNRDINGDECFHDLLDFMYALQPDLQHVPLPRQAFIGVAKDMVSHGELILTPLREYGLEKTDFENLVQLLLLIYLEDGEDSFKELPRDFNQRRDKVVEAFFGAAHTKEVIDFSEFDEALSASTPEIMGGEEAVTNEFVSALPPHTAKCNYSLTLPNRLSYILISAYYYSLNF